MSNYTMSQGLEVLSPKDDKALPIPCNEWDVIKGKVDEITTDPWLFQTAGALLWGAAIATFISVIMGTVVNTKEVPDATVIAWAVIAVCALVGLACFVFASKERKVYRTKAKDIVVQMELIEQRFERDKSTQVQDNASAPAPKKGFWPFISWL